MRERNKSINIRVTEDEKKKLLSLSKKSGLSLSAYMLKAGLNQRITSSPSEHLHQAYQLIFQMDDSRLDKVKDLILKAYYWEDTG